MTQDGEAASRGQASDLFGRGMLYVVIWSMQMIAAVVVSPVLAFVPIAIVVGLVAGRGGAEASPALGGAAVLAAVVVAQLCAAVSAWLLREAFRAWRVRSALAEGEF